MYRRMLSCFALVVALGAGAAAPSSDPYDWVREGNAAFARRDWKTAVACYQKAEERIDNPGLVAHNKAAALYHLGTQNKASGLSDLNCFRDAEQHYRRALEDAQGSRRPRLLYDLGNCLLRRSAESDGELIDQAIECYKLCLQCKEADPAVQEDARSNLELAKLLWLRAKAKEARKQDPPPTPPTPPEPKKPEPPTPTKLDGNEPGTPIGKGKEKAALDAAKVGKDKANPTPADGPAPPGQGTLTPIPDSAKLEQLTPEDALKHLQLAAEQIRKERRQYQHRPTVGPAKDVKDY